jgi:hypothetical protein
MMIFSAGFLVSSRADRQTDRSDEGFEMPRRHGHGAARAVVFGLGYPATGICNVGLIPQLSPIVSVAMHRI